MNHGIRPPPGDDSMHHTLCLLDRHFPEHSIRIGDADLSYRSCGNGPAIVLLHGIGSGAASWFPCAVALAHHVRVIAWNAPGYGNSSALPFARPQASDYAARLRQLLTALEVDQCVLVGHSLGAMVAAAYASVHGASLSRLVLLSPARGYGSAVRAEQGEVILRDRLATLAAMGVAGMARQRAARLLSPAACRADHDWVQWNMAQLRADGYTQAAHLLCGDALEHYPPRDVAGVVYCGDADTITTPQDSRAVAAHFALPFELIAGAGHACYVEQAARTAHAIAQPV